MRRGWAALAGMLAAVWSGSAQSAGPCQLDIQPRGRFEIDSKRSLAGERVGGISGIDYDAAQRVWVLLSDDRSEWGRPRLFEMRWHLPVDQTSQPSGPRLVRAVSLSLPRGTRAAGVPDRAAAAIEIMDGEALRIDRADGTRLVASEGDPTTGSVPWVRRFTADGRFVAPVVLPPRFGYSESQATRGPRPNRSFEGLAFSPDRSSLWLAIETPLLEDGDEASSERGAALRWLRMDLLRAEHREIVYQTDAAIAPLVPGGYSDNGVSDILALDIDRDEKRSAESDVLLALERSGRRLSSGGYEFRSRLYCVRTGTAEDVSQLDSLRGSAIRPANKYRLLDFDALEGGKANFEAMAWGPWLRDGSRWLVVVSDNNFYDDAPTTLLAFVVRRSP